MRRTPPLRLIVAGSLAALPVAAQSIKLNGALAREPVGFIGAPVTSPDGEHLVYFADRDADGLPELYSVPTRGGSSPIRLRGAGPGEGVEVTRDGAHVLYLDDLDANGAHELTVVPIDGSAPPQRLGAPLEADRRVRWFQQSADGAHALYLADQDAHELFELFSVSLAAGTAPVKLSGPLVAGGDVAIPQLSSDGALASYAADAEVDERFELFVVEVDGSQPARKLPLPLVAGGGVYAWQFDGDASNVVYVADQEEDERYELFSIATDGSHPPQKLNGPLVAGGDVGSDTVLAFHFFLGPDRRWVVYSADQEEDERFELYGVPADGSRTAVRLSTTSDLQVVPWTISPDSSWLLYLAEAGEEIYDLYSVPVDGSAPARRINAELVPGGSVSYGPQVSLDSRFVAYRADQQADEVYELYGAPIDGSTPPVKLSAPLPSDGDVGVGGPYGSSHQAARDGVLYLADQERDELVELYFVEFTGAAPRKLASGPVHFFSWSAADPEKALFMREEELLTVAIDSPPKATVLDVLDTTVVGDVRGFELSPAGDRVVYRARGEGDSYVQLYSARTGERRELVRLSTGESLVPTEQLTVDGSRVLFEARLNGLYETRVDGSEPVVELRPPHGNGYRTGSYALSPDGLHVAYLLGSELFVAPVDASAPARDVSSSLPPSTPVGITQFSADSSRIAFVRSIGPQREILCTAPVDGGAPATCLIEALSVEDDFELDARGERVFFRAAAISGKSELHVAPSDASAPPLVLSGTLPLRGSVTAFALDPSGSHAVYVADAAIDETFELFSVPADGSALPLRLHAALPPGRDVLDLRMSGDGLRVVYRSDALADEQLELFSVPVDGSRVPFRISGTLVVGGDVLEYAISPDSRRVVYRADRESDEVVELYSTPIQGARAAKLSRVLVAGGDVSSFQISANSRSVVFAAQRDAAGARTLLAAPIGGQEKAVEIAGPFQGPGSVTAFQLNRDASVVAYVADQEALGVYELYAVRRAPPGVHAPSSGRSVGAPPTRAVER